MQKSKGSINPKGEAKGHKVKSKGQRGKRVEAKVNKSK